MGLFSIKQLTILAASYLIPFELAFLDSSTLSILKLNCPEILSFRAGDCMECIPPIKIFPPLYLNPCPVNTTLTCFLSIVVFSLVFSALVALEPNRFLLIFWLTEFRIFISSPNVILEQTCLNCSTKNFDFCNVFMSWTTWTGWTKLSMVFTTQHLPSFCNDEGIHK